MDILATDKIAVIDEIEFGCDWVEGSCVGMRKRKERGLKDIGYICCRQCAHNKGFLGIKTLPEEYKPYWTDEYGFLEPNVGCKLPTSMKSYKCSTYVCRDANISEEDKQTVLQIEEDHRNGDN